MLQRSVARRLFAGVPFALALLLASCQKDASDPISPQPATTATSAHTSLAKGPATQRPLSDFFNSQNTTFFWYDTENPQYALISDYAGLIAKSYGLNLGTTFDGKITETPLADGTADVVVDIRGENVLTYTQLLNAPFSVVFGATGFQVKNNGATPALGTVRLKWEFINPAPGAPIPANVGYVGSTRIDLNAQAFGELRAASGLGPDGTPGRTWTNQVGLLTTPAHTNKPLDDGYAVEFVKITTTSGH